MWLLPAPAGVPGEASQTASQSPSQKSICLDPGELQPVGGAACASANDTSVKTAVNQKRIRFSEPQVRED